MLKMKQNKQLQKLTKQMRVFRLHFTRMSRLDLTLR